MAKFINIDNLKKYDALIKKYISQNGGVASTITEDTFISELLNKLDTTEGSTAFYSVANGVQILYNPNTPTLSSVFAQGAAYLYLERTSGGGANVYAEELRQHAERVENQGMIYKNVYFIQYSSNTYNASDKQTFQDVVITTEEKAKYEALSKNAITSLLVKYVDQSSEEVKELVITGETQSQYFFGATALATILKLAGTKITVENGVLTVTREHLVNAIGTATTAVAGLMSSQDKTNLDTLVSLLGSGDSDTVVNTINEVLAIFSKYPEGADLVSALAAKANAADVYSKEQTDKLLAGVDLSSRVPTTRTVNGQALNKDIDVSVYKEYTNGGSFNKGDIVVYLGIAYKAKNTIAMATNSPLNDTANWVKIGATGQPNSTNTEGWFTYAEKTKLTNIAAGATADSSYTDTEIETAYNSW